MASFHFTKNELAKIAQYKGGTTIDKSLMYRFIISPLCNRLVKFCPSWLAPNWLTFFGLWCNIINYGIAYYYFPNLIGTAPSFVFFLFALLMTLYTLADNMDGKQAFRTGSSSPLGELFDHGCDSLLVSMGTVLTMSVIQGSAWASLVCCTLGFIVFYFAHWEELFNDHLVLGMLNGPTEAETLSILLSIFTGIVGVSIWTTPVGYSLSIAGQQIEVTVTFLLVVAIAGMEIGTTLSGLISGLSAAKKRGISAFSALSSTFVLWIFIASSLVWIYTSFDIYWKYPFLVLLSLNFPFSIITCKVIVQRMCQLKPQYFDIQLIPLVVTAAISSYSHFTGIPLVDPFWLLVGFSVVSFLTFLEFCTSLCDGLCKQLKIKAWSIPYPNKATKLS